MGVSRRRHLRSIRTAIAAGCGLVAAQAAAQPMDLSLPRPRWVAVRFEISPPDHPGQSDSVYTPAFPAWLEPGDHPGEIRVSVSGHVVESQLMGGLDPVPGSFSDFVWIFDAATGEVSSAGFEGRLWHHLGFGASVQAPIRVQMDTRSEVGFGAPRKLLGHEYCGLCLRGDDRCTLVEPRSYDPETGYVNAVGQIVARSGPFRVRSFSPLGEAIFSELFDRRPRPSSALAGAAAVPSGQAAPRSRR